MRHFQGEITVSTPIWIKKQWRLELEFNAPIENIHSFSINLERDLAYPDKKHFIITPKAFNKNLWPNTPLRISLDGIIESNPDDEHAHGLDVYAMLNSNSRNYGTEKLEAYLTAKAFLFNHKDNVIYNERDDAIGCEPTEGILKHDNNKEVDRTRTNDIIVPIKHRAAEPVVSKRTVPSWRSNQKQPKTVVLKSALGNGNKNNDFGGLENFESPHYDHYNCPVFFGEKPKNGETRVIYKPSIFRKTANQYDLNEILHKSLLFFESQRSGKLTENDKKTIPWRSDSNLRDGCDVSMDLSGGWYFAGDHIKYTYQMAFSVSLLAYGMIDYFDSYNVMSRLNICGLRIE